MEQADVNRGLAQAHPQTLADIPEDVAVRMALAACRRGLVSPVVVYVYHVAILRQHQVINLEPNFGGESEERRAANGTCRSLTPTECVLGSWAALQVRSCHGWNGKF